MNFDNPMYRKRAEDQLSLNKNIQPTATSAVSEKERERLNTLEIYNINNNDSFIEDHLAVKTLKNKYNERRLIHSKDEFTI